MSALEPEDTNYCIAHDRALPLHYSLCELCLDSFVLMAPVGGYFMPQIP